MVSSKDTVSEQVVQARQTRRRRAGFWVRPVLAGRQSRVVAAAGSNSKRDRRTDGQGRTEATLSDWQTRSIRSTDRRHARLQGGLACGRAIPLARVWENSPGRWRMGMARMDAWVIGWTVCPCV